jgi:superfamily II DNA or RNA helicase
MNHVVRKGERYYQEIAVNSAVEAILQGRKRLLLTMATGTGKTAVAFQICWKLWNSRWNRTVKARHVEKLASRRSRSVVTALAMSALARSFSVAC